MNPLTQLVFEQRSVKPRRRGITMMVDWGLPPAYQADVLRTVAAYVDLAKIAVGIGALYSQEVLTEKLEAYRACRITPFVGGMFLEHAVLYDKTREYLQAIVDAGFDCIEISDNLLEMSLDEKMELIRLTREEYHLRVLGEVGKKEGIAANNDPAEDAERCLAAGAEIVFLEAADFFVGEVNETQLNRLIDRCGLEPFVFELPGPWIRGTTDSDVQYIMRWLVDRFGTDANIANVPPDLVLSLEALRLRIGVNAGKNDA
jgi:phosphosulfolactate synthase